MQPGQSSRDKLDAAQALIDQGRYGEARTLLRTIDNVLALDLLDKVNQLDPSKAKPSRGPLIAGAVLVVLVVLGIIVYTQRQHIPFVVALFASPTPTPTYTPTYTLTPTFTLTPTTTYTPTNTLTPTFTLTPSQTNTPSPTFTPIPSNTPTATDTPTATITPSPTVIPSATITDTPVPDLGNWVPSLPSDAATDGVSIALDADDVISTSTQTELPSLLVRCLDNRLEVFVYTGIEGLTDARINGRVRSTVQYDSDSKADALMTKSISGKALFFANANSVASQLGKHSTLVFGFTPVNSSTPVQATFTLAGFKDAVKPVTAACGLSGTSGFSSGGPSY
jgi:hypothetical protein